MGRRRSLRTGERGIDQRPALLVFVLGELHDQDRVLRCQTDQHHQADLRVHVVFHVDHVRRVEQAWMNKRRNNSTPKAPNTATGVLNNTLKGSAQLSYSAARIRKTNSRRNPENRRGRNALLCQLSAWNDMPK